MWLDTWRTKIGPIDSTENLPSRPLWGVQSLDDVEGPELAGYVLTATGEGGSVWGPVEGTSTGGGLSYRECTRTNPHIVAYWPGDDPSGNLTDLIGGNDMLVHTSTSLFPTYGAAGPFTDAAWTNGGSEGFTGSDSWFKAAAAPYSSVFGGTNPWTIESWIYPTAYAATSQRTIMYCYPFGGSTGIGVAILAS